MKKISNNDFELFVTKVSEWQDLLNLGDWNITFKMGGCEGCASCAGDLASKECIVSISENLEDHTCWGMEKEEAIKEAAIHEMLELLHMPIRVHLSKYYADEVVNELIHTNIQRLLKIFREAE